MAHPVQVSLRIPGTSPMPELLRLIQDVEAAGFDGAGILDSQLLCRDTFVTLGQAATQTSLLTLFPAVTNPFSRHVSVLASAIQTVAELAPGRTKVVIGTGYTSASTIGRKPATLAEMRDTITTLRKLLAGDAVDFNGTSGRLAYASGRPVSLLMAASGPRAIELAGEVADGVLLLVGFHRGLVDAVLTHLEQGGPQERPASRGSGDHLGGPDGHGADHGRGAPDGASDGRASGHHARALAVARVHEAVDPALRDPAGRLEDLRRSLARAELGGSHRRDVVRTRRSHRPALRRARSHRHAGTLRPSDRRPDGRRGQEPLRYAVADLRRT